MMTTAQLKASMDVTEVQAAIAGPNTMGLAIEILKLVELRRIADSLDLIKGNMQVPQ